MFENVGEKIKLVAKVVCWIGIISSVIIAISMFVVADEVREEGFYITLGFVFLILGPLISLCESYFLYGFGELIEKISRIERNTRGGEKKSKIQSEKEYRRVEKLERLRAQGLITEEEFQQAILKSNGAEVIR